MRSQVARFLPLLRCGTLAGLLSWTTVGRAAEPFEGELAALLADPVSQLDYFYYPESVTVSHWRLREPDGENSELTVASFQHLADHGWSNFELHGASLIFVWFERGQAVWRDVKTTVDSDHPSGNAAARSMRVWDGNVTPSGGPLVLLWRDGMFLRPEARFGDKTAQRAILKVLAGMEDGLAADLKTLDFGGGTRSSAFKWFLPHRAAMVGSIGALELLAAQGAGLAETGFVNAPLHEAAMTGQTETVSWLLRHGVVPVNNRAGDSPLELALRSGHTDTAELIFRESAVPAQFEMLLAGAAHANDLERVHRLLEAVPKNGLAKLSDDTLVALIWSGDENVVAELLDHGVKVSRRLNGRRLLSHASEAGSLAVCRLLIDHGAKLDWHDREGRTALVDAVRAGQTDVVQFLLAQGADPQEKDRMGLSAVDHAALAADQRLHDLVAGVKLPGPNEQKVWPASAVTVQPRLVTKPQFDLLAPERGEARRLTRQYVTDQPVVSGYHYAIWTGIVEVDGTVTHARVLHSGLDDFIASVKRAIGDYRFTPGLKDGTPVRTRIVWLEDLR